MEILAPAGGPEALRAAVFAGADAVYLAGPSFGARAHAQNFSPEQLKEAVAFCHARGVRVHVAVNTLLREDELAPALRWVAFLCALPVDAVLVQDMGLFSLLRQRAPALPLHASTQMSLHSPAGVGLLEELGASRVVLARELSLPEIAAVSAQTTVELESFLHGALCMCVSGQCYLSAMLGGRSGNRGACAQPCRLAFAAPGGTGHDLSLKDLSFLPRLSALEAAGVCSAKIEGRMKRPEYVAAATAAARLAADREPIPPQLLSDLEAVFSRSGFTDGYLTGHRGREMFGVRTAEDAAGANAVFGRLHALYRGERPSVPVTLELYQEGDLLRVTAEDGHSRAAGAILRGDFSAQPPLPRERWETQLRKTGGTPFVVGELRGPQQVRAGVGQLNALRREALAKLLELRAQRQPISFVDTPYVPAPRTGRREDPLPLRAVFRNAAQVPEDALACEAVALPVETPLSALEDLRRRGFARILLELPRACFAGEEDLSALIRTRMAAGFSELLCGDLGGLALGRGLGARLHGAFGLNIWNTAALAAFEDLGLESAELSFELSARQAERLGGALPRGSMVYGRQALMLTRNCPLANGPRGCLHCRRPGFLTDRKGVRFPVLCRGDGEERYSELLNSVPLWLCDKPLPGLDFGVLRFTVEGRENCGAILRAAKRNGLPDFAYTRGRFAQGVE